MGSSAEDRDVVVDFDPNHTLPESDEIQSTIRKLIQPNSHAGVSNDYQAHLSQRIPGTGDWVFESDAYRQWHDGIDHGVCWIRGNSGVGKSVIASSLIDHLKQEDVPVLYFFFCHTVDTQNSHEAVLRDWLLRLLRYSPPLQKALRPRAVEHPVRRKALSNPEVSAYFARAIDTIPKAYCVVDALDEVKSESLEAVVKSLNDIAQSRSPGIKVVVTSRSSAVIAREFSKAKILDIDSETARVQRDIVRYTQHRLASSFLDAGIQPKVEETIATNADGLFLYAKLVLDLVVRPDSVWHDNLHQLPKELAKVYDTILRENLLRTKETPTEVQEFVLQLVTHATRPLQLLEIADLVRVVHLPKWDLGQIKNLIRSLCDLLLDILPDETVRVVHHSLTEYLKDTSSKTPDTEQRVFPAFAPGAVHHQMAMACLQYLGSGCLDKIGYRPRYRVRGDVNYITPSRLSHSQVLPPATLYASTNWHIHVQRAFSTDHDHTDIHEGLENLLVEGNLDRLEVLADTKMDFDPTPLHLAIGLDLHDHARYLLSKKETDSLRDGKLDRSLILYAAARGNDVAVKLLLDHGADIVSANDRGRTPLHVAVEKGKVEVAKVLLEVGVPIDIARRRDNYFGMPGEAEEPWTPLDRVFSNGGPAMARLFYDRIQGVDTVSKVLYYAVYSRNLPAIKLLLSHPDLDINAAYGDGTPLTVACITRDVAVVKLLLAHGANPKVANGTSCLQPTIQFEEGIWTSPLHAWISDLHYLTSRQPKPTNEEVMEIVDLLLEHGANVDEPNGQGDTAIHLARDVSSLHALLSAGADPDTPNSHGETLLFKTWDMAVLEVLLPWTRSDLRDHNTNRTPLISTLADKFADAKRRVDKALKLLEREPDVSPVDKYGNSALHYAVSLKTAGADLIAKLCALGADVKCKNNEGKTPLHMMIPGSNHPSAMSTDHGVLDFTVLNAILAAGADINASDNNGVTPLFQYVENAGSYPEGRRKPCIERFVAEGASTQVRDSRGRSLLHAQVFNADCTAELLELLASQGLDPSYCDPEGNTLFHEAAPKIAKMAPRTHGDEIIQKLTEMGVSPGTPNHAGRTPLHIVVSTKPHPFDHSNTRVMTSGALERSVGTCGVDLFLSSCAELIDLNASDKQGVRPLHIAATFSEYITRRLLEEGANILQATDEGLTALHLAARSRQANVLGILLDTLQSAIPANEVAAAINPRDRLGRSAVYYAAASGCAEAVQLLLDAGATFSHGVYVGSCWNGCADFGEESKWWTQNSTEYLDTRIIQHQPYTRIMLDAGGTLVSDTTRPLGSEAERFQTMSAFRQQLDDLLGLSSHEDQSEAEVQPQFTIGKLEAVLQVLVAWASVDEIGFIEQAEASATHNGYSSAADCLTQARKQLDGTTQPKDEKRTETIASAGTFEQSASFVPPESPQPRLISACSQETPNMDVIRQLVEDEEVDVNEHEPKIIYGKTLSGPTALHVVAGGSHWWQSVHALPYLIEHGANLEAVEEEYGLTPLGSALRMINLPQFSKQAVEMLLQHGADTNKADKYGTTYLSWTIKHPEIFQLMLKYAAGTNRSALQEAIRQQNIELVQMMLQNGADPNQRKIGEERPMVEHSDGIFTSARHDPNCSDEMYLIHWMATILRRRGKDQEEAEAIDSKIFNMLLKKGAKPFAAYKRTTTLHRIMQNRGRNTSTSGQNRYLQVLLDEPDLDIDTPDSEGKTLLMLAVEGGSDKIYDPLREAPIKLMQKLIDRGAELHAVDSRGRSALHHATQYQKRCEYILAQAPMLISTPDFRGKTPLHYALERIYSHSCIRHLEIEPTHETSCYLINQGANVTHPDNMGTTPLHLAFGRAAWVIKMDGSVEGPAFDLMKLMLARGADINARDEAGRTPIFDYLQCFVPSSGREMIEKRSPQLPSPLSYFMADLILAEVEEDEQDAKRERLYGSMAGRQQREKDKAVKKESILWALFEQHGVDFRAVNKAGQGLLHIVAQEEYTDYTGRRLARFKALLEKGLDPKMEDEESRTPIDLATALGRDDLLGLFRRND